MVGWCADTYSRGERESVYRAWIAYSKQNVQRAEDLEREVTSLKKQLSETAKDENT